MGNPHPLKGDWILRVQEWLVDFDHRQNLSGVPWAGEPGGTQDDLGRSLLRGEPEAQGKQPSLVLPSPR